jgi:hypothetical protein
LSALIFCLMISYGLSVLYPVKESIGLSIPLAVKILSAAIFGVLFFCVAASEYLTLDAPYSVEKTRLAHTLNNHNWHAGIYHAVNLMNQGNFKQARIELNSQLEQRPHNFVALRELAHIEFMENNIEAGCKLLQQYDGYFGNKSSYTPTRLEFCDNQ